MSVARGDFAGGLPITEHKHHRLLPAGAAPLQNTMILTLSLRDSPLHAPVSPSMRVLGGTPIAHGAAVMHAPTSGTVERIDHQWLQLRTDGADAHVEALPALDMDASTEQLLDRIHACGIVGLGGGGYPCAEKMKRARAARARTLILNAVECEPWVTADEVLLREHTEEVLDGAAVLARLLDHPKVFVAIDPRNSAVATLVRCVQSHAGFEVFMVPPRYPAGSERQLTHIVTGTPLSPGARPLDVGAVVINVATAYAVHRAVHHGEPLTRRLISVTGAGADHPCNLWVPIGYPIDELLAFCGVDTDAPCRLGGPVTGVDATPGMSIDKTTYAISVLEPPSRIDPCIHCGQCNAACPEGLPVDGLYFHAQADDLAALDRLGLANCIECGACDLACPSSIALVAQFHQSRSTLAERATASARAARARARFERRQRRESKAHADEQQRRARRKSSDRPWLDQ